ncbi:MAG TPA: penicillin-binding protein 2 [Actinomycetota bacterium]|nr:penicillin-binding protein 2 [Actinomycetota bacterium]
MNRQIRRLGVAMVLLFVILFVAVNIIQVYGAPKISNNAANPRLITQSFDVARGEILAADGRTVLARSIDTGRRLRFQRRYPIGPLFAHITGFFSVKCGISRLESTYNDYLGAKSNDLLGSTLKDLILNQPKRGASVITTIDPKLQQVAFDELSKVAPHGGAVVALDPSTGEVKAMVTIPQYDPNSLTQPNLDRQESACKRITDAPDDPLLSNATDQLYPPGSTFKLIDLSAALEHGMTLQTRFPNPAILDLPQTTVNLQNFGGEHCAGGAPTITLEQALIESCNVTFAELGLRLGPQVLFDQSNAYGFDQHIPFDIPFNEGSFPPPSAFQDREAAVAFSAIGQFDVKANPLQMALVSAAIANGGVQMQPHLVSRIVGPDGQVLQTFSPSVFGQPISQTTASEMTQAMVEVVNQGTGTAARIPGVSVAGKTGTAQTAGGAPHAWFTCFAPADNPQIAVAVVVLNGGTLASEATGGQVAAPVARAVVEAALAGQ